MRPTDPEFETLRWRTAEARRDRTYKSSEVCAAAEIGGVTLDPNTLKHWTRTRGRLQLENPDQSGWTRYTWADLLRVCAWAEVLDAGLSPAKISTVVDGAKRTQVELLANVLARELIKVAAGGVDRKEGHLVLARHVGGQSRAMTVTRRGHEMYFRSRPEKGASKFHTFDVIELWDRVYENLIRHLIEASL